MSKEQQIKNTLTRGVADIYPNLESLEKVLKSGKKLKIYHGIDPTGPTLHLGHMVQLIKLKSFQDLGHKVIILIGDFTAMIGDPTDKSAVRKKLTKQQVLKNAKDYKKQIGKILDLDKVDFRYNSEWLSKLNFAQIIELSSYFTTQQTLARDMFKKRMEEGKDLYLHEFLYPLMQAYDSVFLDVDLEIGGSDQMFNMLAGRTLMKKIKNKEKFVLTTKLLEDPTGLKMGKTTGNMVALNDKPQDIYGKVMAWTDGMIMPAFEIATVVPWDEVEQIKKDLVNGANPKKIKMLLAYKIVELYHGSQQAIRAEEQFKQIFEEKLNPDDITTLKTSKRNIVEVLVESKLVSSKAEAKRLLVQGGIKVDGKKVADESFSIPKPNQDGVVIQKGKRHFIKII